MKIVFLSHVDMNLYLFRLPVMIALVKQGHEVIALTPRGDYFHEFAQHGIMAIAYEMDRSSLNPFKELKVIYQIIQQLKAIKPDVLHTFTLKPNVYGSIAGKLAGVPKIFNSVTGLGSFYIQDSYKTKILRLVIESLCRIAFCFSQKVVFQNNDDLDLYVQKGIVGIKKAVLIKGSGVDVEYFSKESVPVSALEEYQKELDSKDCVVVLMVARAIIHKGVHEYYEAAQMIKQKYPHVLFLFVGDVDYGNIVPITPEFLQSQKHVKWLGKRKDIKELMACSDIFVLPSYREGIPRTLLEAGSMSMPIVSTQAVGCKEVVEVGKNGFLVSIQDIKALHDSIEILVNDPCLRDEMGRYSRHKIEQEFSVDSIIKLHLELYGITKD